MRTLVCVSTLLLVLFGCTAAEPQFIEVTREVPATIVVEREVMVQVPVPVTVEVEREVTIKVPVVETVVIEKETTVKVPVVQTVIVEKEVVVETIAPAEIDFYTFTDFVQAFITYETAGEGVYAEDVCLGQIGGRLSVMQHILLFAIRYDWWVVGDEWDLLTTDMTNAGLCTRLTLPDV